jgi:hypothetical protein
MKMQAKADNLKALILAGYEVHELATHCRHLAECIGLHDYTELAARLSGYIGTLYSPHDELNAAFGFSGEVDMLADIAEIAEQTGASFHAVNDALHRMAEHPRQNATGGFYGSNEIIFIDLDQLRQNFEK